MSKAVLELRFKDEKVRSLGWALLAAVLVPEAQPASTLIWFNTKPGRRR